MPSQLAVDLSRHRARAVEFDGSLKKPRVRGFGAVDLPVPAPGLSRSDGHGGAIADLMRSQKFIRDPAACALDSYDCTFREMDLPFSSREQIDKVIRFEAESELHLVDIEDVVVSYHRLREGRGGSHLMVMAYEKEAIRQRLDDLAAGGVDPLFADLHLTALYTALKATGCLGATVAEAPPEPDPVPRADTTDAEESVPSPIPALEGEVEVPLPDTASPVVLAVECDLDVTHVLVTQDSRLLAARALRMGSRPAANPAGRNPEDGPMVADDSELMVLEMDGEQEEAFLDRLRREIQRSLFPLGLEDLPRRVLLMGSRSLDDSFAGKVGEALGCPVERARPYDAVEHSLDPAVEEMANAEGVAALGVALRMLGDDTSMVDFRQEDLRFAKRFEQLKVVLTCLAIVTLIFVFLHSIVRFKEYLNLKAEMEQAAYASLDPYMSHTGDRDLKRDLESGAVEASEVVRKVQRELKRKRDDLSSALGGEGSIPQVPSGLDVLNEVIQTIDQVIGQVGRVEVNQLQIDLTNRRARVELRGLVDRMADVGTLSARLRECPVVESVSNPKVEAGKEHPETGLPQVQFSGLELELKPEFVVVTAGGR